MGVGGERERVDDREAGSQRINAINLQLITHQLTPGQLVASEQPDNMLNACEPCVYIHNAPPCAPPRRDV